MDCHYLFFARAREMGAPQINYGLLDFAAQLRTVKQPNCESCPLRSTESSGFMERAM
jgi:adenine-specific DNA glycosylase